MGRKPKDLFREASELSESERAELAGLLLESLEGEPDEGVEVAWAEEIERPELPIGISHAVQPPHRSSYARSSTRSSVLPGLRCVIRLRLRPSAFC